jgi:hypothetical protein
MRALFDLISPASPNFFGLADPVQPVPTENSENAEKSRAI